MFADLGLAGKPNLRFLEIGCFEGMTTVWLLENILTHPSSTITVVDTFRGSPEFEAIGVDGESRIRFEANVAPWREKVVVEEGRSADALRRLDGTFDFVYVDGSHAAFDVLTDATLTWPLLRRGAMMVFDDYNWGEGLPGCDRPRQAIDGFCHALTGLAEVRYADLQLVVEKL
jgi:predicted O-methyltransferase YrrM